MNRFLMILASAVLAATATAARDEMPHMPKISSRRSYVVGSLKEGEALEEARGFGEQDGEVTMMNLMMVEGSGMAGMDMGSPPEAPRAGGKITSAESANAKRYSVELSTSLPQARVGTNLVKFSVTDTKTVKPARGILIKAEVRMTGMDMGRANPPVLEISPGVYELRAAFAMKGPWTVLLALPGGEEHVIPFNAVNRP